MVLADGVGERLKALRSKLSVTQKKFANLLNCSQAKISDYESGKLSISNKDLSIIANTYNVNLNWLITGEGEMFNNVRAHEGIFSNLIRLPVVGDIAAGFPIELVPDEPTEYIDVPTSLLDQPPPYYVFKVNGESMLPVIHPGDYVIISNGAIGFKNNQLNGRICAFRTADGITLKQLVLDPSTRTTWLWPINSSFNPIPFTKDTTDFTLIGVLVLSIRKYT
jgi:SOS-response transcriptional repressor LexA